MEDALKLSLDLGYTLEEYSNAIYFRKSILSISNAELIIKIIKSPASYVKYVVIHTGKDSYETMPATIEYLEHKFISKTLERFASRVELM